MGRRVNIDDVVETQPLGSAIENADSVVENEDDAINSNSDDDDEYDLIDSRLLVRAKWTLDGAASIDQIIEKLRNEIRYYETLRESGWELVQAIDDDYGWLRHPVREQEAREIRRADRRRDSRRRERSQVTTR